jgi:hypothetical protein
MLIEAGLRRRFSAEAVDTAEHFKNRRNVGVKVMTDNEGRNSTKVHLCHLHGFGSLAFMHIPDQHRRRWDPKSRELVSTRQRQRGVQSLPLNRS